jgi:hypothetical protein
MGREKQINEHREEIDKLANDKRQRISELEEKKREAEAEDAESIQREIDRITLEASILDHGSLLLGELGGISKDNAALEKKISAVRRENSALQEAFDNVRESLNLKDEFIKQAIEDNKTASEKTHKLIERYLETYKEDQEDNSSYAIGGLVIGLVGLAASIAGLVLSVLGYEDETTPKDQKTSPKSAQLSPGDGAIPGTMNTNLRPSVAPRAGASSSLVGAGAGGGTETEPSTEELEEMMQTLVVHKELISSGQVPQDLLWQHLASATDKLDLDAQDATLMFIQEAAVALPGSQDFFWLDPSDATDRYEALREAYKRSSKLSDVYIEATKLEYNGKKIPTFHVALLLQLALRLIKRDLMFG